MIIDAINKTIKALCGEIQEQAAPDLEWRRLSEDRLWHELAVCMFSSQMLYETALGAANRVYEQGLLSFNNWLAHGPSYENSLIAALSEPLSINVHGVNREARPRFKNRLASLLNRTMSEMNACNISLHELLDSSLSEHQAREQLMEQVWGFGPKQASLFLRRIGYCTELAVLDTHLLDYLKLALEMDIKPSALSNLSSYKNMESQFQTIANDFGYPVGCVDLATWITMRVAKRDFL